MLCSAAQGVALPGLGERLEATDSQRIVTCIAAAALQVSRHGF